MTIPLTDLERDTSAVVAAVEGGSHVRRKLDDMGIRVGTALMKKGGQPFKGPVIVQVGAAQVAIGHGMALKIFVELPA